VSVIQLGARGSYSRSGQGAPAVDAPGPRIGVVHSDTGTRLVVTTYVDTAISYTLGSAYIDYYYPENIYRLNVGDSFTVHVKGVTCSGTVDFSGHPVKCQ
jgi:hypothetical protein